MDQSLWQEIKRAHEVYNSLQTEERQPYLDQIKGENEPLYHALIDIIQAEEQETTFLSHSAFESIQPTDNFQDLSGLQLGNYRLKYLIGVGGMGQVYLADRTDLHAHQQVAIKIIHKGYQSDLYNKRFDRERRILSKLNHPHITRIYDGGITQDGMSYIVMEYIQGVPIMEYIQDNQLLLKDRLTLFKDLCSAVQYAHQNFIMHRDLKPSNVLVNAHGMVKIIDFGIAKILEEDEAEDITMMGYLPMTPAFASPEQLKGQPLTVSSDIYSLGVLLYELLTGKKPFHDSGDKSAEIWSKRLNDNIQIPRPSSNIQVSRLQTEPRLASELQGDLDNIVLKSLRENPDERYHSAGQLLEDIERYEKNYPVLAQPDSTIYRFKKYIRRNKNFVILATCLILALIAGIVTTLWQATIASAERDQANKEAAKAEQITEFVTSLFEHANPDNNPGEVITSETMLDMGSERLVELDDQPALQAEMYKVIGELYSSQNLYQQAIHHLEKSKSIYHQLGSRYDRIIAAINQRVFDSYVALEDYTKASEVLSGAEEYITQHFLPQDIPYLELMDNIAWIQLKMGHQDSALYLLESIQPFVQELDENIESNRDLMARHFNIIAGIYKVKQQLDLALDNMKRSLRLRQKYDQQLTTNTCKLLANIGNIYTGHNNDSAEYYTRRALEVADIVYGDDIAPIKVYITASLAQILRQRDKLDDALQYAQSAYEQSQIVYGPHHSYVAWTKTILGDVYIDMGSHEIGLNYRAQAMKMLQEIFDPNHSRIAYQYYTDAQKAALLNDYSSAIKNQSKALELYIINFPENEYEIEKMKYELAYYRLLDGQNESLREELTASRDYFSKINGSQDSLVLIINKQLDVLNY